jgi:hypothetical protein
MADDQTNPYTMMGMLGMMSPNKFLNPMYKDKPLPMPGYYGDPTDASGQKIQSFQDTKAQHDAWDTAHPQGTTLNSTPQSSGNGQLNELAGWQALTDPTGASRGNTYGDQGINASNPGGNSMTGSVLSSAYNVPAYIPNPNSGQRGMGPQGGAQNPFMPNPNYSPPAAQPQQQAAAPAASNPFNMRQAYLDALSDPQGGKPMPVQGATVPQSQPLGTPSVMSAFLQAHPSGASTGSYSNKPFFDTLNQLQKGA